ncbi:influenza virus NS1A-binding protein homolog isoform X2 [Tigriopus californicus]|uniref:influenza virus NS1A-binding protein homolog isoform X2 n=1 Tax=Tigriopus californicus TaxID=6832 RepID=UPI0027DA14C0|nr:influenza virus NS1A-binding protein homolog isoform X2 [Tigriopus californicus]|eukprot:TCALIF_05784-PA protein Name:"Similar to Ivns1abp Influenza virus NS1A-binding protein homolog (Mus musculus)" AED:0.07 eAED:0.07 QI:187/0.85/0.62/1/1/1/8/508/786
MRLFDDFNNSHIKDMSKKPSTMDNDDDSEPEGVMPRPDLLWEDTLLHGRTLQALNQMRKDKHFCDVTLQIDKQDFPAHRAVLAAASPYLLELFTSRSDRPTRKEEEGVTGVIYELNGGFNKEALEILIEYAYTARLTVPARSIRTVFLAAIRLRMERASHECAKFLADHINVETCLELRNMPGITKLTDLVNKVDSYIQSNFGSIQESRGMMALPRICIEVLHNTKVDIEAAKSEPLCQLALDWIHIQWLEDEKLTLDSMTTKRHLLYVGRENKLEDCKGIEEGSPNDSEIIQDYKKTNQKQLPRQMKKIRRHSSMKPAKPRELLYSRHINQDEEKTGDVIEEWKMIACSNLDDKTILGLVTVDGLLAVVSIIQRLYRPTTPDMTQPILTAAAGLTLALANGSRKNSKGTSPTMSRPPSEESDLYDPLPNMASPRCAVGTCQLDGKLIVCGGYDRGECLNNVDAFSLESNSWSAMPRMSSKRGRFDTAVLNGVIYAVAGSNGHSEQHTAEKFNPETGKWTSIVNLPFPVANIGLCSLNGSIYCIGGTYGQSGSKNCFKLAADESKWERIAPLQLGRSQAGVASFQGKIWVVGGCDAWNPVASVEVYDPDSNSWKLGPPMTTPRRGCGIINKNGLLYVIGGSDGTKSLCTVEIYDPRMNLWTSGPNMTSCRANVSANLVDDRIWAVGGFSGKNFLSTIEYLDPVRDEWTTYIARNPTPKASRGSPFTVEQVAEDDLTPVNLEESRSFQTVLGQAKIMNNVEPSEKRVTIAEDPPESNGGEEENVCPQ